MTPNKDLVSDHVRTLIKSIHTDDLQKKVFVIAAAVELLRRVKLLDKNGIAALVNFYSKVDDVAWEKIQFSFTQAVSGRAKEVISQYAHESLDADKIMLILLKAISVFTDILAESPDEASQEVFDAVVAELADNHLTALAEPEGKPAPPVFHPGMLDKIFKPVPVTDEVLAAAKMRHVLFTGHHGVRSPGLLFEVAETNWIILETGEVLHDIDLSRTAPELSEKVSPLLACYFNLYLGWFALGDLTVDADILNVNLQTLVDVFDMAHEAARIGATGATGPVGATVRFPLRDMDIVFEASADTNGPYATAKLVNSADGTVLMRLDRPRENTPMGVYLFPFADRVIVVRARETDGD